MENGIQNLISQTSVTGTCDALASVMLYGFI